MVLPTRVINKLALHGKKKHRSGAVATASPDEHTCATDQLDEPQHASARSGPGRTPIEARQKDSVSPPTRLSVALVFLPQDRRRHGLEPGKSSQRSGTIRGASSRHAAAMEQMRSAARSLGRTQKRQKTVPRSVP